MSNLSHITVQATPQTREKLSNIMAKKQWKMRVAVTEAIEELHRREFGVSKPNKTAK